MQINYEKFDEIIAGEISPPYITYFEEGFKAGMVEGLKVATQMQRQAKIEEFEAMDKAMDEVRIKQEEATHSIPHTHNKFGGMIDCKGCQAEWSLCDKCDNRITDGTEGMCQNCL